MLSCLYIPLELLCLIHDVVVFEIEFHVERTSESFPSVTTRVFVDLFVSLEDFVYRFLAGNLSE